MVIGFLAWLELLLESGPPGPKRAPHGRPVKQTNKQISHLVFVYISLSEGFITLLLKSDDDQGNENVQEKEWKDDEVDYVEQRHLDSVIRLGTQTLFVVRIN